MKEAEDDKASEDQSEAVKKEPAAKVLTRNAGKRGAQEPENMVQTTILLEPDPKRLKTEKEGRKDRLPAKSVGYGIVEVQPVKTLTHEEAISELHLTNGNMRVQILTLNATIKRREELMAILKPVIDDPMDALK